MRACACLVAGRTYAVYGGFFIVLSLVWERLVDGKSPDTGDYIGVAIALAGVLIMLYYPRGQTETQTLTQTQTQPTAAPTDIPTSTAASEGAQLSFHIDASAVSRSSVSLSHLYIHADAAHVDDELT